MSIRRLVASIAALVLLSACGTPGPGSDDDGNGGAQPPTAPSDVTVTAGYGYNVVAWTDNSDNETGFVIYRSGGSSTVASRGTDAELVTALADGAPLAELPPNTVSYLDDTVVPGESYNYSVAAAGPGGVTTPAPAPGSVEALVGLGATMGVITLDLGQGTSFLVHLAVPEATGAEAATLTFTGPPGWIGAPEYVTEVTEAELQRGWAVKDHWSTSVVPGDYTVALDLDGTVYETTTTLRAEPTTFPQLEGLGVTSASSTVVEASWQPQAQLLTYAVELRPVGDAITVLRRVDTLEGSVRMDGLELTPGEYILLLRGYAADLTGFPLPSDEYGGIMTTSEPFQIR